ncbi:BEACH domain-containing protein [Chloropicon primus]|uniref:BEACH domain-containing protein n=3 Tax=Chloropicon primus TaxID=1764295 RepID=A0A5B8MM97_9CHLO|nr:BEACH domain-containing protein [Chloropicon primus]|eukprot:QDZ21579.1 BEACH domain-containing protein [Chloropicon primus]
MAGPASTSYGREDDDELVVLLGEGDLEAKAEVILRLSPQSEVDKKRKACILHKVYRRLEKEIRKLTTKKGTSTGWDNTIRTTLEVVEWSYDRYGGDDVGEDAEWRREGEREVPGLLATTHRVIKENAYVRSDFSKGTTCLVIQLLHILRKAFGQIPDPSLDEISRSCLNGSLVEAELETLLEQFSGCVTSQVLSCLCSILRTVAAFTCTVKEAWQWVSETRELANLGPKEAAAWRLLLLSVMNRVLKDVRAMEPGSAFALSGSLGGIICDGCAKWPFNNGFCFLTQICIDRLGASSVDYKPRLFTFVTSDGQGIEGFFEGPFLAVVFHTGRTARSEVVHFKHAFRPRSWYSVAIQVEKPSLVKGGKSKLALWVDGNLMDAHSVDYKKIHKPLSAFCIGTRPPAIRGNHSFLSDADDSLRFNLKGFLGPVHVYHHNLSDSYLKRMVGNEAHCLPNHVLRVTSTSALGSSLGRRRSFSGDAKGLFSNLLAFYHPLLVRGSVCPNAVGLDFHTLSDSRQNQAHLSASVTVCRRVLATSSFAACGEHIPRLLISILSEKAFWKDDARSDTEDVSMVGIASHVLSTLASASIPSGGSEEYLGKNFPLLLSGVLLQVVDRLTEEDKLAVGGITGLLSSLSDFMDKTKIWKDFCEYLLFNRRIWESAPGECKVQMIYIIGRYCERFPTEMLEMGVAQPIFCYLSECTFEHKKQKLTKEIFNATYTAVAKCIKVLVLEGGPGFLQEVIGSCVAYMSSLSSTVELEHLILIFEEILGEAGGELQRMISKMLIQEKFVEITLNVLSLQDDKNSQHFCEMVMVHTIPLFSKILTYSQREAESQFAETYYTMSTLIRMVVFSKETSSFVGKREYCSILCSSLANLEDSKSYSREQVLSGTCVLKNMMFLSPFILGLHKLEFEIQEAMLHDLTFLFCTNAENRRVFTAWDEWYVSMLLVYLYAWSNEKEGIMDSCINLIQVLAQHAYRGHGFFLFAHQVLCSTLVLKTDLYKDYLGELGGSNVYDEIDAMTSSVMKQLLSFAMEDLIIDQKPKVLPKVELCELNSLILLILIDRYYSFMSLCSEDGGHFDISVLSEFASLDDWVDVKDAAAAEGGGSLTESMEMGPNEVAGLIIRQVIERAPVIPERNKLDLLCTYGSNRIIENVLGELGKMFHMSQNVDVNILNLALKNLEILLKKENIVKHIHRDRASHLILVPLTRLILVSLRLSTPEQKADLYHLAFLEKLVSNILSDSSDMCQAISFALTVIIYEEVILSLEDSGYPLKEVLVILMKLVQKWQTLLQDNLLQDSQKARRIHENTKINSLPAPLLLAQQNLLSISSGAIKKTLDDVLVVQKSVLGSTELSAALNNLLTTHEIKQTYHFHETFLSRIFLDMDKGVLLKESVVKALANIVKEKKSQNSATLHQMELANQEKLELSTTLLLKLLKKTSFVEQSSYASVSEELRDGQNNWKVEKVENSCRKRSRLTLCTKKADYQPASEKAAAKEDKSIMNLSNLLPVYKGVPFFEDEEDEDGSQSGNSSPRSTSVLTSPGGTQRGLEERKNLKFEAFALLVTPKGTSLGWIDICKNSVFFTYVDTEEEIAVYEEEGKTLPMSYMRSFVNEESVHKEKSLEWDLDSLSLILVRRYCLRRSAIEMFHADRTSYFFDFGSPDLRQKAYQVLVSMKPQNLHPLCYHSQNPEKLVKKSEITEQWVRREISNFEYLMHLNTFAGRSYNDITQYPVFPWVLSDYKSEKIDLNDASVFRDLSRPVGALNEERLKKFVERYNSFEDEIMPKFHYGSHYSSSGIVLYYLLRLEPFAGLAVSLQGGKFDHADRLFDDLPGTWEGVLSDMSDVKELIPEFYYCPEILRNVNNFNLGTRQDGKVLGDVSLPPWASDAADFISKHQQALESEYVSSHLHEWIDLVFGCKQRGEQAVEACNVFFYMTYEGQVDIDAITDPMQQKAALDQIAHFGQTPYQLFKAGHPCRMPIEECICPLFATPAAVKSYEVDAGNSERTSIGQMRLTNESIVMMSSLYPYQVTVMDFQANTPDSSGLPFSGKSKAKAFTAISTLTRKLSAVTNLLDSGLSAWSSGLDMNLNFKDCTAISEDGRYIFSCGYLDYTIRFCDSHSGRSIEVLRGMVQPTCLKLSQCGSILAVGFRNSTVGVWVVQPGLKSATEKVSGMTSNMDSFFFNSVSFADWLLKEKRDDLGYQNLVFVNTLSFCCGAVRCVDVNTDLDTVVALTYERELIYHSLSKSTFTKVNDVEADSVMISNENFVVATNPKNGSVSCFSMNGLLLRTITVPTLSHLEPQAMSNRGKYLALSGSIPNKADKVCKVLVYNLLSMELTFEHDLENFVASCAFSSDDTNLVAVLDAGEVMVFTDPATSLKLVDQMLRLGWQESGLEALQ